MNDVLRELYNGEIYQAEEIDVESKEYRAAAREYEDARKAFKEKLPQELTGEFEKLKDYEGGYGNECDIAAFRKGFQLGMQLAIAGLDKDRLAELIKD